MVYSQTFTRKPLQSSVIKYFLAEEYNFEDVTVPAGSQVNASAAFDVGTVLGRRTLGAATSAAKSGGNTGVGTFVVDGTAPVRAHAQAGVYQLRVIATGRAVLKDPNGVSLGEYEFGAGGNVTIDDEIKGVLTDDGTTHFVAGDGFDITVAAGDGKYVAHDAAALDGSQNAAAVVARNWTVDASVDTVVPVLKRGPAVVVTDSLVFKSGIAAADKTTALAALEALGIVSHSL